MIFVTLLLPKGKGCEAIKSLKELKAPKGITIRDLYFTFGRCDGVLIFEAENVQVAMNFVMQVGLETHYTVETLVAIPVREI